MMQSLLTIIFTLVSCVGPIHLRASEMIVPMMPAPGTMVALSQPFAPALMSGITVHPDNALQFDFIMNRGQDDVDDAIKLQEYNKLIKYFLASITIPEKNQWVNLSPYEKDRIIQDDFSQTEMGRDLLAQDYLLKQITSSLMYPESGLGQEFWNKIYARVGQQFGKANIPVNTFNKVWIVPTDVTVYESGNSAVILKSHLKVMLEEDYIAKNKNIKDGATLKPVQQMIRDIILPEIEKEVNEGKNFSTLRQVVSAMVLATWYKRALKESLLGRVYMDQGKVEGVDLATSNNVALGNTETIYQQYLQAFKKGVFNIIKEEKDFKTSRVMPRKYFAGGFKMNSAMVTYVSLKDNVSKAMTAQVFNSQSQDIVRTHAVPMAITGSFKIRGKDWVNDYSHEVMADELRRYFIRNYMLDVKGRTFEGVLINGQDIVEATSMSAIAQALKLSQSEVMNRIYQGKILPFKLNVDNQINFSLGKTILDALFLPGETERVNYEINANSMINGIKKLLDDKSWDKGIVDVVKQEKDGLVHVEFINEAAFALGGINHTITMNTQTGLYELNVLGQAYAFEKDAYREGQHSKGYYISRVPVLKGLKQGEEVPIYIVLNLTNAMPSFILMTRRDFLNAGDVKDINNVIEPDINLDALAQFDEDVSVESKSAIIRTLSSGDILIENIDTTKEIYLAVGRPSVLYTILPDINNTFILQREAQDQHGPIKARFPFIQDDKLSNTNEVVYTTEHAKKQSVMIDDIQREFIIALVNKNNVWSLRIYTHKEIDQKIQRKDIVLIEDSAMNIQNIQRQGGIDLNAEHFDMQIKRDGKGMPLPFALQDIEMLKNISGFTPKILEIKPAINVPILSEIQERIPPFSLT